VRRPLIGLTTYLETAAAGVWEAEFALLHQTYVEMVVQAGGVPVLLPPVEGGTVEAVSALDALVLTGGSDVDPARYGAEPHATTRSRPFRDEAEVRLLHVALDRDLPVLGVCRGAQLMNVALGGSLTQHLPDDIGHSRHAPAPGVFGPNRVRLAEGSRLAAIVGTDVEVRCHHHQALDRVADGLQVVGWSTDDTVEAIELAGPRFAIGVQWHPEQDATDKRLFDALVEAATAQ
jgi:gamma-glutamyl-gamma-aminobutyrate hydrolase PuuD